MKHSFVYFKVFEVDEKLVVANNIDEAISIFREATNDGNIYCVREFRDGEYALCKIANEGDVRESFGDD